MIWVKKHLAYRMEGLSPKASLALNRITGSIIYPCEQQNQSQLMRNRVILKTIGINTLQDMHLKYMYKHFCLTAHYHIYINIHVEKEVPVLVHVHKDTMINYSFLCAYPLIRIDFSGVYIVKTFPSKCFNPLAHIA